MHVNLCFLLQRWMQVKKQGWVCLAKHPGVFTLVHAGRDPFTRGESDCVTLEILRLLRNRHPDGRKASTRFRAPFAPGFGGNGQINVRAPGPPIAPVLRDWGGTRPAGPCALQPLDWRVSS